MSDIVRISSVTRRFGDVIGVDDVSLSVREGEFVSLLGPSGCGKSTLLRMIGGFETPDRGAIFLGGDDVTDLPPHRRAVNMVFQDYALFPHMSVGRNVGYGLRVSGTPKSEVAQRAKEALDQVGLGDKFESMPHALSGGQRQRVALARALVRRPKVLLLDEPLSALDANLRESMQVELRRLHRAVGLTFIMVTHDQDEALAMADRVIVMRSGRVVQDGAPEDLYERPKTAYVAGFVGRTNLFSSEVREGRVAFCGQPLDLPTGLRGRTGGLFGFRPERARLTTLKEMGAANHLSGRVAEVLFHGSAARFVIEVGDDCVIVDRQLSSGSLNGDLPRAGEEVTVEVDPQAIMAFDAEAAE